MRFIGSLLLFAALAAAPVAAAQPAPPSGPLVSRLIVKLRDDPQKAAQPKRTRVALLARDAGVDVVHVREMALGLDVVRLDTPRTIAQARTIASRLGERSDVEFAEVDLPMTAKFVPNDSFINSQEYLADGATGIGAFSAWDVTTGSPNTVIAVIDTGVLPHAELSGRFVPGWDFVSSTLQSGDGDGRDSDPSDPGDFVTQADLDAGLGPDCHVENSSWHGTMVTGVIAAAGNNHQWIAGIDWAAKIEPLRALGKCGGSSSDVIDAIAWAAGLFVPGTATNAFPAHVINLSLGGRGDCLMSYQSVIQAALATGNVRAIVAAAGNDDAEGIDTPANCPGVISVVSTTSSLGRRARYSNYGAEATIAAPGGQPLAGVPSQGIYTISNTGTQGPAADSFAIAGGTSLAAPMVSGAAALVLAVAPNTSADSMRTLLTSTAKAFPAASDCTTSICGAGIVDVGNAVRAAVAGAPAANYEGLWWNSAESGWGINLAHQGDQIYLTWYTYDGTGKASWLAMLATKTAPGTYSGNLIELRGPSFDSNPFAPAPTVSTIGSGTLTFSDGNNGTFSYVAKAVTQTKTITRYPFAAPPPACTYGAAPDFASATNYQDLWWNASESGWGINLTHQGNQIYATWYTYDTDGAPLWLASLMSQTGPSAFSGALFRTSGTPFGAPWNAGQLVVTTVGNASLVFSNGNAATWTYNVGASAGNKAMTRYLFAAPAGTVCH